MKKTQNWIQSLQFIQPCCCFTEFLPELGTSLWRLFQVVMLVITTPQAEILKKLEHVIESRQKAKVMAIF